MAEPEIKMPKTVKRTETYTPPIRYRTLWRRVSAEDEERRIREEKVRDLLPEEEEDTIGKVYDAGLLKRLLTYLRPYQGRTIWAVVLMAVSSLLRNLSSIKRNLKCPYPSRPWNPIRGVASKKHAYVQA